MAVKSETKIVMKITRFLKDLRKKGEPIWWFKVHGGPTQQAGIPDMYVLHRGITYWLEVKTPVGKLSPLQAHTIKQINAAGGAYCKAFVVRSVQEVIEILGEVP